MMTLSELLDRPVAFQRAFVRLGAGVTGALMLSQAIYWSNRTSDDGWFYKSQAEWEEETGLTRYEQEGARAKLAKLGILEEKKQGIPCRIHYRVNMKALRANLLEAEPQPSLGKTSKQELDFSPTSDGENNQPIYTETTTEITTETTTDTLPGMSAGHPRAELPPGPKDPDALTFETWQAYANAYRDRYGAFPVWNKANGGKIAQIISRLGKDVAPQVARFYLSINDRFYVLKMHAVGNLLADCESIYTQWATGRTMTHHQARDADRHQAIGSMTETLREKLRREGKLS